MNFVPYWGYQLNKTCCSLSLFLPPPKKPRRLCTTTTTTTHIDRSIFLTFSDSYRHTYIPLFLRLRVSGVYVCVYTAYFFYSLPLTLLAQSSRTRIASTTSISFPKPTKLECSHHFFFFSLVRCCCCCLLLSSSVSVSVSVSASPPWPSSPATSTVWPTQPWS